MVLCGTNVPQSVPLSTVRYPTLITKFPLETCCIGLPMCQTHCCTKLSKQHTPIKCESTRTAEGIVNTIIHSQMLNSSTHRHTVSHSYTDTSMYRVTHTQTDTAGGGKHSLIGLVTSCLSIKNLSSLHYSVHCGPTLQHFNQPQLELEFPS